MKKVFRTFLFLLLVMVMNNAVAQRYIPKTKIKDLQELIAASDKPFIINFWASFCIPCLEELPHFQQAANDFKADSLNIIFVSLDQPEAYPKKINLVLNKLKITSQVMFLDEANADDYVSVIDKNWSGAIPATLFIDNKRNYKKFIEDPFSKKQLEKEIRILLQKDN